MLWGLAGAFIYAAPRWAIALASPRDSRPSDVLVTLEALIALIVGCLAAGAFGPLIGDLVLTTLHVRNDNAVCTLIGLLANRVAPDVIEKGSTAFNGGSAVIARVLKALKGGDEK